VCLAKHYSVRKLFEVVRDLLSEVVFELGKPWCLVHPVWKGLYPERADMVASASVLARLGDKGRQ